jgi:hypothetical protein
MTRPSDGQCALPSLGRRTRNARGSLSITVASASGRPCRSATVPAGLGARLKPVAATRGRAGRCWCGYAFWPAGRDPPHGARAGGCAIPQWRGLAIKPVDSQGTVNAIFRVGDQLAARLPLEPGDPRPGRRHLKSEARAARDLAAGATPAPRPRPTYRKISHALKQAHRRSTRVQHGSTATHLDAGGFAGTRGDGDLHGWTRVDVLPPDGMREVGGSGPVNSTQVGDTSRTANH